MHPQSSGPAHFRTGRCGKLFPPELGRIARGDPDDLEVVRIASMLSKANIPVTLASSRKVTLYTPQKKGAGMRIYDVL